MAKTKIKKNKPILYLDMDGVIADLDFILLHVIGIPEDILYGRQTRTEETKKIVHEALQRCVNEEWFIKMPLMEYARVIEAAVKHILETGIADVEILTSTGNFGSPHEEVERQKLVFLKNHFAESLAPLKTHCVRGWQEKAKFATPTSLLFDDSIDNINAFMAAGGMAIAYVPKNTVEQLHTAIGQLIEAARP